MLLRLIVIFSLVLFANSAQGKENPAFKNQKDKASYSIGINIGKNMKMQSEDIDPELLILGIRDAFSGNPLKLTEEERTKAINQFQQEMRAKAEVLIKEIAIKNQKEGDRFLAENKKKKGVVTLESGLQYKVLTKGKGDSPKLTDTVKTHYRGTLIDGTEFDSSYSREEPTSFPVNGVIRGWTEALQLMKVGSKWQLFIPPDMAYGNRGAGPKIGPDSTLVFEIELLSIQK